MLLCLTFDNFFRSHDSGHAYTKNLTLDIYWHLWISVGCQMDVTRELARGAEYHHASSPRREHGCKVSSEAPCNQWIEGCPSISGTQGSEPEARFLIWFWFGPWTCLPLVASDWIIQQSTMPNEKQKLEVPEDKFNAILKRLIDHKPVTKKNIKAPKKKLGKIIQRTNPL